jgi:hypothetical protein
VVVAANAASHGSTVMVDIAATVPHRHIFAIF